jgi:hypothetical protein
MTYALGRGIDYFDMPRVRQIVAEAKENNYAFSALVIGIATSDSFRMKQIQPPESPATLAATTTASN